MVSPIRQGPALTQLIPIQELPPGGIGAIRNQVIKALLAKAVPELHMLEENLVVRDVRPLGDLQMYSSATTDLVQELWANMSTVTAVGYLSVTGDKTMADQRYVALYGVRDRRASMGPTGSATVSTSVAASQGHGRWLPEPLVSLIKISVGGGDKVIWDMSGLDAYMDSKVAVSPSAVIIPQNTLFNISYYKSGNFIAGAVAVPVTDELMFIQLMGVVVEPRGKVVSP